MKDAIAAEVTKSAPAVAGVWFISLTLNEWVAVATFLYVVFQALYLARKWWREEKS